MEIINYDNPGLLLKPEEIKEGKVSWRSPSNLAIIKYWGKYGTQFPRNPSISFTLENAYTETTVYYRSREKSETTGELISLEFFFEDQPNPLFRQKVQKFLESLLGVFPFLRQLSLVIRSKNSFPHSSGIASSASSMSALALCLCALENKFFGTLPKDDDFRRKASFISRLGSGSACRSIYPVMAVWGESGEIPEASNAYAIPFESFIHDDFKTFHDDILIVSKGSKAVSSRAGHALMDDNVYAESRYSQARQRFHHILHALKAGDFEAFGQIAEMEALTLHALMMTSSPPYILMKPNTIALIEKIQDLRFSEKLPIFFSLDAGPNIHLLYPDSVKPRVEKFIRQELLPLCENNQWIADKAGTEGPVEM